MRKKTWLRKWWKASRDKSKIVWILRLYILDSQETSNFVERFMSRAFVVPWFEISFIFSKKCQAQGKTAAIRKGFHQFNNEFGFLEFGNSLEKYLAWLDTKRNCWRKFLLHIFLHICVEFLKDVKSLWTSTRKHKKLK